MKTNHKLAFATLTGFAIGVAGTTVMYAQQPKALPGYLISELDVTDPVIYQKYSVQVPERLRLSMATISFAAARPNLSRAKRRNASW